MRLYIGATRKGFSPVRDVIFVETKNTQTSVPLGTEYKFLLIKYVKKSPNPLYKRGNRHELSFLIGFYKYFVPLGQVLAENYKNKVRSSIEK